MTPDIDSRSVPAMLPRTIAATLLALATPALAQAAIDSRVLGARYGADGTQITFRVYSARATRMQVYIYKHASGAQERVAYVLTRDPATQVWSRTVAVSTLRNTYGITGTVYYGYRAWGPNWPYVSSWTKGSSAGFLEDVDAAGNRFNPNKLLLDPYAREVSHDPLTPSAPDGTAYASGPLYRSVDTGTRAPKGLVLAPDATPIGTKPTRALKDEVIYEVHLRGLTRNDPAVPAAYRGTYRGAGLKAAALAALGVTAIELLPVQETQNDTNDVDPAGAEGDNYWGYSTLNYFAPDRRYAYDRSPGGPTREFKAMVKAFHDAGLKVLLDVVYNHTGEGGAWDPADKHTYNVFSFRGLDNRTYYSLTADFQHSWDNTGVGGNYNTRNSTAQDLIVDSLAYWKDTLGVDGFRYDLASVLGNTCEHGCFDYDKTAAGNALNRILAEMPARPGAGGAGVDWIAEPWAIGGGRTRSATSPRDGRSGTGSTATRQGQRPGLALRPLGRRQRRQPELGPGRERRPSTPRGAHRPRPAAALGRHAHDHRRRRGAAQPALQQQPVQPRLDRQLALVHARRGPGELPHVRPASHRLPPAHPALRPADFYSGADTNGNVMEQLRWFTPAGTVPDAAYWNNPGNHAIAWRIDGTELGDPASAIYVAYNGWSGDVTFTLPWPGPGRSWYRVTDTSAWAEGPDQFAAPGTEAFIGGEWTSYLLRGRGVLLLIAR